MGSSASVAHLVVPARAIRGRLSLPGDKSISHRYALLAALSDGTCRLDNFAPGRDGLATLQCLEALGVDVRRPAPGQVVIDGRGIGGLEAPSHALDAMNSGSTMRMLAGVVAGHPFMTEITGDASLRRRPMRRVAEPLERMGARVEHDGGRPPLRVHGGALRAIEHAPEVPSAQVKSAVLLAGLHASGDTTVVEPVPTRDHTERALATFGWPAHVAGARITVRGGARLRAANLTVPGDPSSAAFWAVAAAALPGSDVHLCGVGLNPTRTAYLDILVRAGALVERRPEGAHPDGEPAGTVIVRHGSLHPIDIGPDEVPGLIDELPVLAALATFGSRIRVTGAAELRHKESDRISALVTGLRALGADAEEWPDGFEIRGHRRLTGGSADAAGDHRLAMAFAIAALGAEHPSTILGAEAVDVSYPGFFDALEMLRAEGR